MKKQHKENFVDCLICGNSFNNAYKTGRLIKQVCSKKECYREIRRRNHIVWRKKQRKKLRVEHRCIWCKKKVKPITTFPQFCKEHNEKNRNSKNSHKIK